MGGNTKKVADDTESSTNTEPSSSININGHKQHEAFEDENHDMIEDLSVDPALEAAEKEQKEDTVADKKEGGKMRGPGGLMGGMFGRDPNDKEEDSYVEETTDA